MSIFFAQPMTHIVSQKLYVLESHLQYHRNHLSIDLKQFITVAFVSITVLVIIEWTVVLR